MKTYLRAASLIAIGLAWAGQAHAVRHAPAQWRQELLITRLVGYRPHEFLVTSNIVQPESGGIFRSMEVRISAFSKAHTTRAQTEWEGRKCEEVLTVSLSPSAKAKELKADFVHEVLQEGGTVLKFSGTTILPRI
ncbi:MAG TPA: hypothetical protein VEB66_09485 [Opitutaceae bacterium]|nr:hypothetical protein [Opitutaceae bacterium]